MEVRRELLRHIVSTSLTKVSDQYPHGYMMLMKEQHAGALELHEGKLIIAYPGNVNTDGSMPVVPTEAGVKWVADNQGSTVPTAANAPVPPLSTNDFQVRIDDDVPMPEGGKRGFPRQSGGSAVDRYGFGTMEINQSFHVPPSGDPNKIIYRTFSSVVSQANDKLYPKHFAIREAKVGVDPQGAGARVWRVADLVGPKPERTPRKKKTPIQAPPAATGGGFPAPAPGAAPAGFGGFGGPAPGFGGPAPDDAPEGFGGGFGGPPPGFGG